MTGILARLLIAAGAALVIWLIKIAVCMGAVRLHAGTGPALVDKEEVLWRSALAAAGLTLLTPIEILAFDDLFTSGFSSMLFWVAAFTVVPLGGLYLMWIYALEDYLTGLSIFGLYVLVPLAAMGICRLASVPARAALLRVF